jgi:hypothetical protein
MVQEILLVRELVDCMEAVAPEREQVISVTVVTGRLELFGQASVDNSRHLEPLMFNSLTLR